MEIFINYCRNVLIESKNSSDRIFKMIADAESGVLFSLLPITALFVSTSMFTIEHVIKIDRLFLFGFYLLYFFSSGRISSHCFWNGYLSNSLLIDVAISFLPLCHFGSWSCIISWWFGLWLELDRSSGWNAKICHFDDFSFTWTYLFLWIWYHFVLFGNIWKSTYCSEM